MNALPPPAYGSAVSGTPWGQADDLRARKLRPGRGGDTEANAREQRERLFGATVLAVGRQGYERTSVADLLELAGVSRATFYHHFDDRQDCFEATYTALIDGTVAALEAELNTDRPWADRLEAAFARLLRLLAAYPLAAHVCLVDVHAAGPAALSLGEHTLGRFERLLRGALAESPDRAELPIPVVHAILGGAYKVVASRVRRGRADELPALRSQIATWALGYRTPPGEIRRPRGRKPASSGPDFGPYGDAGRIYAAAVVEIAKRGYQAATIEGIATRAGASAHTFYNHFDSKHDALLAAYDAGIAQAYAFTQPAVTHAIDWPHGFRAALQAMFSFLAGDPAWTRAMVLEAPAAGPVLLERIDEGIDRFAGLLAPGSEQAPGMGAIGAEATAGAIYALHYRQIRKAGPERLPEVVPACTYVGLAPFIGAERALAVANDGARTGRRPPRGDRRPPAQL